MPGRTLSEIAYNTVYLSGVELSSDTIDAALRDSGIDPTNETERTRFQKLVLAVQPLKKEDVLCRCRFATEARKECGPDADLDLVIQTACQIEEQYLCDVESYEE
jgi:hypothetical protein